MRPTLCHSLTAITLGLCVTCMATVQRGLIVTTYFKGLGVKLTLEKKFQKFAEKPVLLLFKVSFLFVFFSPKAAVTQFYCL